MNICFLGSHAVGKTTFIAALNHMTREGAYFDLAYSNDDSGRIIQAWVESLIQGNPLAPTTATLCFKGDLCFADGYRESVEFRDIVGDDFEKGYVERHIPTLEQIRPFVHQCEHLFFFVEPADILNPDSRALITFVDVLSDYVQETGLNPRSVTVVLTKADLYSDLDEKDPVSVVRFVCAHHESEVNALRKLVSSVRFVSISVKREQKFCLTNQDFDSLFSPIRRDRERIVWRMVLRCVLFMLFLVAVSGLSCYAYKMWQESVTVHANNVAEDLIKEMGTTSDYQHLKDLYQRFSDEEELRSRRPEAGRFFEERAGEIRGEKIKYLRHVYEKYMSNPGPGNLAEYDKALRACTEVDAVLPPELELSGRARLRVQVRSIIDTQHNTASEPLSAFMKKRCRFVREYLEAKTLAQISDDADDAIKKAVELAECLSSPNDYIVSVRNLAGITSSDEYFFTFSTSKCGKVMEANENLTPLSFTKYSYPGKFIKIRWCIDQPLSVTLWEKGFSDTRVAYADRATGDKQHFPIAYFCREVSSQMVPLHEDYSGILVQFQTMRGNNKLITTGDLNDVYTFILADEEWKNKLSEK